MTHLFLEKDRQTVNTDASPTPQSLEGKPYIFMAPAEEGSSRVETAPAQPTQQQDLCFAAAASPVGVAPSVGFCLVPHSQKGEKEGAWRQLHVAFLCKMCEMRWMTDRPSAAAYAPRQGGCSFVFSCFISYVCLFLIFFLKIKFLLV